MLNASIATRSGTTYGLSSHNNYQLVQLSKSKGELQSHQSKEHGSKSTEEPKDHAHASAPSFRPERLKHKVVISSEREQARDDQPNDMSSLESAASQKMIVWLRKDFSVHTDEQPRKDSGSGRTMSES